MSVLTPTSRLLELLELLQSQPLVTGREIAAHLDVDRRTVRRYVEALQDMGIPVEGQRGVGGGYRMRPGYRLPPLMLRDEEAVAVVLGLVAARRLGLDAGSEPAGAALEKIQRVLPATLRRRVEALTTTLEFTEAGVAGTPVAAETLLLIAEAIRRGRRLRTSYTSFSAVRSRRELSLYGLVVHSGHWYVAAYDHGRAALRTFRADRMSRATLTTDPAAPAPGGFDAVDHVSHSLASVPWTWDVAVVLNLPLTTVAKRIPPTLAGLVEAGDQTLLHIRVSSLDWMAGVLASLGCEFAIERPDELRARVGALAEHLAAQVS